MQIQIDIREKELIALSKENTNTNYDIIHKSLPLEISTLNSKFEISKPSRHDSALSIIIFLIFSFTV